MSGNKLARPLTILIILLSLSGCLLQPDTSIVNRYAEALLTKNNELQFRFKINEKILSSEQMYKIKVLIHNEKLASALGTTEVIYGQSSVYKGEYLDVKDEKDYIYMEPIPLQKDLHTFELKKMIEEEHAITVEVFTDQETIGKAYLTNFDSQL